MHMGEKGNLTSDELSAAMAQGSSAMTATAGQVGDAVTTVVTDGGTTVVKTASSLGEKLADKGIGIGGDEIHERLKKTRATGRPEVETDAPAESPDPE
jgi:hypothetical protein